MNHNEKDDWQIPPTPGAISIEKIFSMEMAAGDCKKSW